MQSAGKSLQIYCINLKERSDRWQRFMSQPGIQKIIQYYPFERMEGVDGKKLNIAEDERISLRTRRNILMHKRRDHEDLDTAGGVGCYLSHYNCWNKSLGAPQTYCLILEDDAIVPDDFMEKLEAGLDDFEQNAKQAELWFLSRPWGDFLSRAVSKARPDYDDKGWTFNFICPGTGYILTKAGARALCDNAFPIDGHVDFFIHRCAQMGLLVEAHKKDFVLLQHKFSKKDSNIQEQESCVICNIPIDPDKKGYLILTNQQMTAAAVGAVVAIGLYAMRAFGKSR